MFDLSPAIKVACSLKQLETIHQNNRCTFCEIIFFVLVPNSYHSVNGARMLIWYVNSVVHNNNGQMLLSWWWMSRFPPKNIKNFILILRHFSKVWRDRNSIIPPTQSFTFSQRLDILSVILSRCKANKKWENFPCQTVILLLLP